MSYTVLCCVFSSSMSTGVGDGVSIVNMLGAMLGAGERCPNSTYIMKLIMFRSVTVFSWISVSWLIFVSVGNAFFPLLYELLVLLYRPYLLSSILLRKFFHVTVILLCTRLWV